MQTRQQHAEYMRDWRRRNPEKVRAASKKNYERIKADPAKLARLRAQVTVNRRNFRHRQLALVLQRRALTDFAKMAGAGGLEPPT